MPTVDVASSNLVIRLAGKPYGFDKDIHTPALLDAVRKDWRALRPLVERVSTRLG